MTFALGRGGGGAVCHQRQSPFVVIVSCLGHNWIVSKPYDTDSITVQNAERTVALNSKINTS